MKFAVLALVCLLPCAAAAQPASPPPDRCDGYISAAFAKAFADEWVAAWNSHDMSRVLAHYTDDFEMSSPFIITSPVGDRSGTLKGKAKVAAYWQAGIDRENFALIDVFAGAHSIAIHYLRLTAPAGSELRVATETEEFNADCKVIRSNAMYGGHS
jgi:ketosteroid isomerase-like protein